MAEGPTRISRRVVAWLYAQTGFGGKTLWDWMKLLIVPLMLAVATLLFNSSQETIGRELEATRQAIDREIEADRQREAVLQAYLDNITELLLKENLLTSEPDDPVREVARVRTVTALRILDGKRNGTLLQFLSDAGLVSSDKDNTVIDLSATRVRGIDLREANLFLVDLRQAYLEDADLRGAALFGTDLRGAYLHRADLKGAVLFEADLHGTYLLGADLDGAALSGVDLREARVTDEQLAQAMTLVGTTMPDGSLYNGRFILESDIGTARESNIDTDDPKAMADFYHVSVEDYQRGQESARENAELLHQWKGEAQ